MAQIRRRRRGSRPVRDERDARLEVSRELGWAKRTLNILRTLYVIDGVIFGIICLVATQAEGGARLALFAGIAAATAILGAVFIRRQPVAWSFVLAIVHSIPAAFDLLAIKLGAIGFGSVIRILLAVLLWCTVKMAIRTQELLDTYGDLAAAKRLRGDRESAVDASDVSQKWRAKAKAQSRVRNKLLLIGVLVCAVGIGLVVMLGSEGQKAKEAPALPAPTTPLTSVVPGFVSAWMQEGVAGVLPLIATDVRNKRIKELKRMARRYEWDPAALPKLGPGEAEMFDERRGYLRHAVDGYGRVTISWEWEEGQWVVTRWKFKRDE